jgi:transcriptional regulator with XRE-family HTH domain
MSRESRDGVGLPDDLDDYTDDAATFGDRLALAREALGLDQDELAGRMGVTPVTLRAWEEDRAEPRANRLQLLAGTLNVSLVWLMTGQGSAPRGPGRPELDACLAELRALRDEQARLAGRLARLERRLKAALG